MFINERLRNLAVALEWCGWLRRTLVWAVHLGMFLASGAVAFLLRFDFNVPASERHDLLFGLVVWITVKSAVFRLLNLDRGWWRFVSISDVMRISSANLMGTVASALVIRFFGPPAFPRSVYFLDLVVCLLATSGGRVLVRLLREVYHRGGAAGEKQTLIYGAGAAGISLLREIRANPKISYAICGFVDDDHRKARLVIQGVSVLGTGADLSKLATTRRIEMVLIAVPAATGSEMTRILRVCQEAGVAYKTVPGLGEIIEGNGLATQIRDVAVEDLLGRNPVRLEDNQIRSTLEGKGRTGHRRRRLHRLRTVPPDRPLPPRRDCGIRNRRIPPVRNRSRNAPSLPPDALLPRDREHTESNSRGRGLAPVLAVGRLSRRRLQARPHDGGPRF